MSDVRQNIELNVREIKAVLDYLNSIFNLIGIEQVGRRSF